ncbi:uncharacterized protein L969DRAFT_17348 [Mixia osmundae IAM 14324]|uniref:Glycosyltransferase family 92 protein n=1 Tax=Mixia osmundae (strain CBS 9802 / IAM 14324 / JCM 22182 / KY 12970) TaxID=764103 RepID=G7E3N6_MIXOS|nr:uncharacterized protein L969DRAFT_17348 [Mixia osmundae IAM 14324]KEI39429.1 hypothetical protein L969DRAFT_17348 [Mixia osmundae IAM 14324]GAA97446.1 hypothetical protein E5Q_04125 [Mixia osmundae IAM 14324]
MPSRCYQELAFAFVLSAAGLLICVFWTVQDAKSYEQSADVWQTDAALAVQTLHLSNLSVYLIGAVVESRTLTHVAEVRASQFVQVLVFIEDTPAQHSAPPTQGTLSGHAGELVFTCDVLDARIPANVISKAPLDSHRNNFLAFVECDLPERWATASRDSLAISVIANTGPEMAFGDLELGPIPRRHHALTACMPPIDSMRNGYTALQRLLEWRLHHDWLDRVVWQSRSPQDLAFIDKFVDKVPGTANDTLILAPMYSSVTRSGKIYYDQTIWLTHCAMRHRHTADWLVFVDLDEFIQRDPTAILAAQSPNAGEIQLPRLNVGRSEAERKTGRIGSEQLVQMTMQWSAGPDKDPKSIYRALAVQSVGVHHADSLHMQYISATLEEPVINHYRDRGRLNHIEHFASSPDFSDLNIRIANLTAALLSSQ